jgi:hypothetical protein
MTKEAEAPTTPEYLTPDAAAEMVNKAITAHGKRQEAGLAKMLAEQFAQFSETLKPKPAEVEEKDRTKVIEAQLAALQRQYEQSEKARKTAEDSARKERTHGQLKAALEGAGARKEALDVLVAAWSANGTLRYDDAGNAQLAIKRARTKGGAAEELIHDDFAAGVADWVKSQEASIFVAPPVNAQAPAANGQNRPIARYTEAAGSEEEKARRTLEMLEGAGLNALGQSNG